MEKITVKNNILNFRGNDIFIVDLLNDGFIVSVLTENTEIFFSHLDTEINGKNYNNINDFFNSFNFKSNQRKINKQNIETMQQTQGATETIRKPLVIKNKTFYHSAKYRLGLIDYLKGFLVSVLGAALFALQQVASAGNFDTLNYKPLLMAAISGGAGYLIKNFFSSNNVRSK